MDIIKGKPIPRNKNGTWERKHKYPYKDLQVGECFFVADKKKGLSASTAARNWGLKYNRQFTSRLGDGGVYVWRIR